MPKLIVTNRGRTKRERLGKIFKPNETVEMEVSQRNFLTIKAVRDLEVEIVDEDTPQKEPIQPTKEEIRDNQETKEVAEEFEQSDEDIEEYIKNGTVDEIKALVEEGQVSPEQAHAIETSNKNRTTLIEWLEEVIEEG